MATRILFNGKEYAKPDDMPADVRRLYDSVLARFPDNNQNGVADILEKGAGDVISIRHSEVSVNGAPLGEDPDLPDLVHRLLGPAASRLVVKGTRSRTETSTTANARPQEAADNPSNSFPAAERDLVQSKPHPNAEILATLDRVTWTLGRVLQAIVLAGAIFVLVGGIGIILSLDAGSKAQGGAFYIGVGILLAEGWLINTYFSLRRRG
jgi:hypothetical protein